MRGKMNRDEWQQRARELAKRGEELPQSKLTNEDVIAIRHAGIEREIQRQRITSELSNRALANRYGVHLRTIERVMQREGWIHLIKGAQT